MATSNGISEFRKVVRMKVRRAWPRMPTSCLALYLLLHVTRRMGNAALLKDETVDKVVAHGSIKGRHQTMARSHSEARNHELLKAHIETNDGLGNIQYYKQGDLEYKTHADYRSSNSWNDADSLDNSIHRNSYSSNDSSRGVWNGPGVNAVLPGQPVAAFSVDTPMGPFRYDPATSVLPVVVMVFNAQDPFQRAMWSAWSLQMFLRHAPLAAADYLFVPYTYSPAAAADMAYYMYREIIAAAREVYGNNETTDEELRTRVLTHIHFSTTPATAISPQILLLLHQWTQDMKVLHARVRPPTSELSAAVGGDGVTAGGGSGGSTLDAAVGAIAHGPTAVAQAAVAAGDPPEDGLTVGRLDAWYGWLPSPASVTLSPAPLVAFEETSLDGGAAGASRSACDPTDVIIANGVVVHGGSHRGHSAESGCVGGRFTGSWVFVSNSTREAHPNCTYTDIIVNMQHVGALGVIFESSPGVDAEVIAPTDPEFLPELLYDIQMSYNEKGQQQQQGRQEHRTHAIKGKDSGDAGVSDPTVTENTHTRVIGWRVVSDSNGVSSWEEQEEEDGDTKGKEKEKGDEILEEQQPYIPATMVSYSDGLDLVTLLKDAARNNTTAEVEFRTKTIPTGWFTIDPWVGLTEAGWAQLPAMMHAGWAAWWHVYLGRLRDQLRELRAARSHVVLIFKETPFPGPHGATASDVLLPRHLHHRFQRLLLDFSLGCSGPMDTSCPAWDHMVQLFACCDRRPERCQPCPTTLWKPSQSLDHTWRPVREHEEEVGKEKVGKEASEAQKLSQDVVGELKGQQVREEKGEDTPSDSGGMAAAAAAATTRATVRAVAQRCGFELGRWATPFRRRVGRWLTDVTSLMGLLDSGSSRCSFTVQTAPWADGNWTASLSIRFVRHAVHVDDRGELEISQRLRGQTKMEDMGRAVLYDRMMNWTEMDLRSGVDIAENDAGGKEDDNKIRQHHLHRHRTLAVHNLPGFIHRIFTPTATATSDGTATQSVNTTAVTASAATSASATKAEVIDIASIPGSTLGEVEEKKELRPFIVLPLFNSAPFDASYNRNRSAVTFRTPSQTRSAAIVSYITGHGSDPNTGCCEFFPTSHHLFVNGREVGVLNFTEAGTAWGCADAVLYGSVPNQHGTWFYGRGGWCDGAAVTPWVVDVSKMLMPPGSPVNNTIWYKALYGDGRDPSVPPEGSLPGYIMMQSLMVLYGIRIPS